MHTPTEQDFLRYLEDNVQSVIEEFKKENIYYNEDILFNRLLDYFTYEYVPDFDVEYGIYNKFSLSLQLKILNSYINNPRWICYEINALVYTLWPLYQSTGYHDLPYLHLLLNKFQKKAKKQVETNLERIEKSYYLGILPLMGKEGVDILSTVVGGNYSDLSENIVYSFAQYEPTPEILEYFKTFLKNSVLCEDFKNPDEFYEKWLKKGYDLKENFTIMSILEESGIYI